VANIVGAAVPYWTTDLGRWIGLAVLVSFTLIILVVYKPDSLSRSKNGQFAPDLEEL
jgi:hypothetical protein